MASPDLKTIRDTINVVDLALSGVPVEIITGDDSQFAFGVLDGMRATLSAFENPELTVGEIFDRVIEGDATQILENHDRAIGMLSGSIAIANLLGKSQVQLDSA